MSFKVITLPPHYSEADEERRAELMRLLAEMQDRFRRETEPLIRALADIDAHYAPRMVIFPDAASPLHPQGAEKQKPAALSS